MEIRVGSKSSITTCTVRKHKNDCCRCIWNNERHLFVARLLGKQLNASARSNISGRSQAAQPFYNLYTESNNLRSCRFCSPSRADWWCSLSSVWRSCRRACRRSWNLRPRRARGTWRNGVRWVDAGRCRSTWFSAEAQQSTTRIIRDSRVNIRNAHELRLIVVQQSPVSYKADPLVKDTSSP